MTTLHLTMSILPDPEDESKQCVELSSIGEAWFLQPFTVKELKVCMVMQLRHNDHYQLKSMTVIPAHSSAW